MSIATVTVKGQITIPKEVRDVLHIKNGDRMTFVADGDKAVMVPLKGDLSSIKGVLKNYFKARRFDAKTARRLAKRHVAERYINHRHGK